MSEENNMHETYAQIFSTLNSIYKHLGSIEAKLDIMTRNLKDVKTDVGEIKDPNKVTPSESGMSPGRCPI